MYYVNTVIYFSFNQHQQTFPQNYCIFFSLELSHISVNLLSIIDPVYLASPDLVLNVTHCVSVSSSVGVGVAGESGVQCS